MSSQEFLKYFITEDIYQVPEKQPDESIQVAREVSDPTVPDESIDLPEIVEPSNEVLLIVRDEQNEILSDKDRVYLEKILHAVKLSWEMVDVLNLAKQQVPRLTGYQRIMVFCTGAELPFSMTTNYAFTSWEGTQVLMVDPPEVISASVELRKKLWSALQQAFLH